MPNFEKNQPRKFSPIHYEPRTVRADKAESLQSGSHGTDIFLQKQDRGIRYKDWASTPPKEGAKSHALYVRSGFWATLWESIRMCFRKPTPLIGAGTEKKASSTASAGGQGSRKNNRFDKRRGERDFSGDNRQKEKDKGGRKNQNQPATSAQPTKSRQENQEGGQRKSRHRKRRPGGQEQNASQPAQTPSNNPRPQQPQTPRGQQPERQQAQPLQQQSGGSANPSGNEGDRKPGRNRRNRNRRRSGKASGNGPAQHEGE